MINSKVYKLFKVYMGNIVKFIFTKIMLYKVGQKFQSCLVNYHFIKRVCMWCGGKMRVIQIQLKVKSCYNPLRVGTVIVLVSSGIDFVNTPRLYSDRATR